MVKIELKAHQKPAINFIKNNFGLILYHSTGSGKTITALTAMYQFNKDIVVIGPKSAKKAFKDEIEKLGYDEKKIKILTYAKAKMEVQKNFELFKGKCVIVDEAHHLRSETKYNLILTSVLVDCHRIMLLTATPIVNYINDISPLVNIVKRCDVLPTERDLFNFFYFDEIKLEIENKHLLKDKLKGCISYYCNKGDPNFPKSEVVWERVVMDGGQLAAYEKHIRRYVYDYNIATVTDIFNVKFDALKRGKLNSFLSATRQISNTVDNSTDSAKLKLILKRVKNNTYPAVIYSNFLKNGVYPMAKLLLESGISHKTITGNTHQDKLMKIVEEYNSRKFDVLLITTAASESLDLKNTKQIHVMEPHWNDAKIQQVIGRTIRYKSHSDLPVNERFVKVFRWISVFPDKIKNASADEYLLSVTEKKQEILDEFNKMLIEVSIEKAGKGGGSNAYYELYKKYKKLYKDHKK